MEAKTLQQIKDEISVKYGYKNWDNLCGDNWSELDSVEPYMNEAAELYAQQICEKQREICGRMLKNMPLIGYIEILNAPLATDKK